MLPGDSGFDMGHCIQGCGESEKQLMSDKKTEMEICTKCLNNYIENDGQCYDPVEDAEQLGQLI